VCVDTVVVALVVRLKYNNTFFLTTNINLISFIKLVLLLFKKFIYRVGIEILIL